MLSFRSLVHLLLIIVNNFGRGEDYFSTIDFAEQNKNNMIPKTKFDPTLYLEKQKLVHYTFQHILFGPSDKKARKLINISFSLI